MQKNRMYRGVMALAIVALCGLLVVQVYWFTAAYQVREQQFDNTIRLALRALMNRIASSDRDLTSPPDVRQVATNAYEMHYPHGVPYATLDSMIRSTFVHHQVLEGFELIGYSDASARISFANSYVGGVRSPADAMCLERGAAGEQATRFAVVFPHRTTDIMQGMGLWIFSALTFIGILSLFAIAISNLSKEKAAAEMKADFVSNMIHELQTPVANIGVASEVLRRGRQALDGERITHYMSIIAAENLRLKSHIERVLQTAIIEQGELALEKNEVNINLIVEEVIEVFRERVQCRGGVLQATISAANPLVYADAFHLKNIIYNLLDNAEKYSPQSPRITVCTKDHRNGVCVSISDNGIGIDKAHQKRIFEKFFRAIAGNIHNVKGFGLGLTYVRNIVEAHNGWVTVRSSPGAGSRFEVVLQN